jgi:PiT family inorganic phosphate transporter
MVLAQTLMSITIRLQKRFPSDHGDKIFGRMQLASSAFLSLMHGSNDAQKTAGIITGVLVSAHYMDHFDIPFWVLGASYGMMGLGTLVGGWRIVDTLGNRLTRLKPNGGFCAETSAALSILLATMLELPVSTTQVATGAIIGVGAARSVKAVRWNVAGNIFWAWVFTIPAASAMGAGAMAAADYLAR